ncbi:MAG: DUF2202 domain-containing protein [Phycisphaeraceae bacterium]|nr:MAG: DUF2202 domain-containing protein [Phycisphaeraceae bacterium]
MEAPVNRTVEALILAYNDERRAEAFYAAVMAKHGEVRPFSNIIQAERRHQAMLVPLLERFGVPIPAEEVEIPEVPETLRACCEAGTRAEEENIALHDKLLPTITDDAVLDAFKRLQWASRERHLVAFKRCAEGGGQGMGGRGPGGGGGRGRP